MFNKTSLEMAEKDLELLLWPSKLYPFLLGVEHNVTFLFEGALLGKEFLLDLSNFVLLFNMHNLLEQLKDSEERYHCFKTVLTGHSLPSFLNLIFRIWEPEGACILGKALLFLTNSATEKGILCAFGSVDIFCLNKVSVAC